MYKAKDSLCANENDPIERGKLITQHKESLVSGENCFKIQD